MAEDKKNFLQGKMNQDIDDRILPNGEYRSAQNIQVTTSQKSDVGSIQNLFGNVKVNLPASAALIVNFKNLETIGSFFDETNNRIFYFITNYICPNPDAKGLVGDSNGPKTAEQQDQGDLFCGIFMASNADAPDPVVPNITILVSGLFLNFSKTNLITGVNLLEDLLFFTDNLNQPRKINVQTAIAEGLQYYNREEKISVAKFAPFMPPLLLNHETTNLNNNTPTTTEPTSSMELFSQNNFPKDFLREKFVRFSYRYRFDDGEYSTIAPFTQICFIPKTKSYSITDFQKVFKKGEIYFQDSTGVADGMVNSVTAVNLNIILPSKKIKTDFNINAIELLYKESDNVLIRSIELKDLKDSDSASGVYEYKYKSTLPYKTLPKDQLTRVYDNVPLSAQAQEIISNRVVYGNYVVNRALPGQNSGAPGLNFSVGSSAKYDITNPFGNADFNNYYLHKEYPFHSIKQRRTYEIGVVLSDKFGRQSPVLTSTLGTSSVEVEAKDENFHSSSWDSIGVIQDTSPGNENYCGDALNITFNEKIPNSYATHTFVPIQQSISTLTYANDVYKLVFHTDPILSQSQNLGELYYYSQNTLGLLSSVSSTDFIYTSYDLQEKLLGYSEIYFLSFISEIDLTSVSITKINLNPTTGAVLQISNINVDATAEPIIENSGLPVLVNTAGTEIQVLQSVSLVIPSTTEVSGSFNITITNFNSTDLFEVGDYLLGQNTDFVEIIRIETVGTDLILTTDDQVSLSYKNFTNEDTSNPVFIDFDTYAFYKYNLVTHGWYSYRVVVKQVEQEYSNVYTAGAINFDNEKDEDKTYIPIAGDNINKITRDIEFANTQEDGLSTSRNIVYPKVVADTTDKASSKQSDGDLLDVVSIGTAREQGLKNENNAPFAFVYESDKDTLMAQLPFGKNLNNLGTSVNEGLVGTEVTLQVDTTTGSTTKLKNAKVRLKNQNTTISLIIQNSTVRSQLALTLQAGKYLKGANKDLVKIIKFESITETHGSPAQTYNRVLITCDGEIKELESLVSDSVSTNPDENTPEDSVKIKVFDYRYGTQDRIGIFETKPFESSLDIYYETSTAGLVHELNQAVDFPTTAKVLNLFDTNDFNEGVLFWDTDNNFQDKYVASIQLIDQFGNEITPGTANSQIPSDGIIITGQVGVFLQEAYTSGPTEQDVDTFEVVFDEEDNLFKIRPTAIHGNFVYYPEQYPVEYNFEFQITNNSGETENLTFNGLKLENLSPVFEGANTVSRILGPNQEVFNFNGTTNGGLKDGAEESGLIFVSNGRNHNDDRNAQLGIRASDGLGHVTVGFAGNPFENNEFIQVPLNRVLFDSDGNPIPELLINNETGTITTTSLFKSTLNVNVDIRIIDSNDPGQLDESGTHLGFLEGFTDEENAFFGGKSTIHRLNIVISDGLIVLDCFTMTSNQDTDFILKGENVPPSDSFGIEQYVDPSDNTTVIDFDVFKPWSSTSIGNTDEDYHEATAHEINLFGVFLCSSKVVYIHPSSRGDEAQPVTTFYKTHALGFDSLGNPKVKIYYGYTFETVERESQAQTIIGGLSNATVFSNHWLKSTEGHLVKTTTGNTFSFERTHLISDNNGGFSSVKGQSPTDVGGGNIVASQMSLFETVGLHDPFGVNHGFESFETVDPHSVEWDVDFVSSHELFGTHSDDVPETVAGAHLFYNEDNEVVSGIARPINRVPVSDDILNKAWDDFEFGGINYSILYETTNDDVGETSIILNRYETSVKVKRVFLCKKSE